MKRMKKHKVKKESPETSTSNNQEQEDHDLAFYIHDRVELMHQVFSILKYKELITIAPECIRHISVNDLQELCTEELLGISSKRLCAILDGAPPPSDTDSSSQSSMEQMETISLDSISSDEAMLSPSNGKRKKHKHRRRDAKANCKPKSKGRQSEKSEGEATEDKSKASRAGLTVLELLELQARARAIRAQLHQDQAAQNLSETQSVLTSDPDGHHSDVEIKEEPAEVVEISSDEEKPNIEELEKAAAMPLPSPTPPKEPEKPEESEPVVKRINDLIVTVPQAKPTRKIKLNRSKVFISVPNNENSVPSETISVVVNNELSKLTKVKKKQKKGKKKRDKDGSDHDEITLQLSDSEKMDLLEDLDRKAYDTVSSSEDSGSSSNDDEMEMEKEKQKEKERILKDKEKKEQEILKDKERLKVAVQVKKRMIRKEKETVMENDDEKERELLKEEKEKREEEIVSVGEESQDIALVIAEEYERSPLKQDSSKKVDNQQYLINLKKCINLPETTVQMVSIQSTTVDAQIEKISSTIDENEKIEIFTIGEVTLVKRTSTDKETTKAESSNEVSEMATVEKHKSDGELSDRDSSEVEAVDLLPVVVCISDEESRKKKKKKKDKKKKDKKDKKSKLDFRKSADQNFFRETDECNIDDEAYEILELSDDSSCYDVEGTVLSKEPTREEIAALSAKIDEIDREDVVTDEQIQEYENAVAKPTAPENISWKDRYLDSTKVKQVLSTANLFNALRKKNKELKKKIEESKEEPLAIEKVCEEFEECIEDGSIEQYNTLHGSTKYVAPVVEVTENVNNQVKQDFMDDQEEPIMKEMKKDAKQLLKMYKRLINQNGVNKPKDPERKKKKKQKKNKDKNKGVVNDSVATSGVVTGE